MSPPPRCLRSHYEPDRSALKKKEWERRTQEVQQDEDLFSSGFNLFGEPYKTSKGDALASRVQNTLGNYDEMKELLTSQSNQSHLVGIPKNSVPQTPVEKLEQPSFFSEGQRSRSGPAQSAAPMAPPVPSSSSSSSSSMSGSALMHSHQGSKKSRTSDWPTGGQPSSGAGPLCGRSKHGASAHETSQGKHEDLFGCQVETHKGDSSPTASSSHSRRHGPPAKAPPSDPPYKEVGHSKSPGDLDAGAHGSVSPVASTSLLPSGVSTPTFPQGLHCKPSVVQQKPTAYVRPMDGQDQVPNDSPELKPPMEIGDGYNNPAYAGLIDGKAGGNGSKSKLPKLTLPPQGEVSPASFLTAECWRMAAAAPRCSSGRDGITLVPNAPHRSLFFHPSWVCTLTQQGDGTTW
ncbi:AF4/FMR2 family member 2-like [Arapaima gigas]